MTVGRLHIVTDDEVLARPGFTAVAESVLRAGGADLTLHIRGHGTPGGRLHEAAAALVAPARAAGARVLVNDRVDVALSADADGVQLGRRSLPVERVRRLLGGRLLGYSAHGAREAAAAAAAGADFVVLGTIFETPAHAGAAAGAGLLAEAAALMRAPLVAIGGVTPERVPVVLAAGAAGVAVRAGVWDAREPAAAVAAFAQALAAGGPAQEGGGMQTAKAVEITVNGVPRAVPAGLSVAGLLHELGLHPGLVVVEHNREILERSRVPDVEVHGGDVFEIVHFVGGG